MKWKLASKYHLETECGRYTVSKTLRPNQTWQYTAWRRAAPKEIAEALGRFDNANEARACAEAHAQGLPSESPSV